MIKKFLPIKRLAVNHCGLASRLLLLTIFLLMVVLAPSALYAQQKIQSFFENYTKDIEGYGSGNDNKKYYLIASPIGADVNPRDVGGMDKNRANISEYDLYYFDQHEKKEWRNYKSEPFLLSPGKGYLFARSEDGTLTFSGASFDHDLEVPLSRDDDAEFAGWNLVGNPYSKTAYIDREFYRMNEDGSELILSSSTGIEPMEGVFVFAYTGDEMMTFSTEENRANGSSFSLELSNNRGVIDRTIVRFGSGRQLPKFQLWESSTKLFIPINGTDYAVIHSQGKGELPVHFKAKDNGSYTISLNSKEVRFAYLHLIDKLTGDDIDLLAHPDYTFNAKKTDDPSRFHLVFSAELQSPGSLDGATFHTPDKSIYRINRETGLRLPNHGESKHQDAGDDSGEEIPTYTLSLEAGTGGNIEGGSQYVGGQEDGTTISLLAVAAEGYCFLNWTENGEEVSTNATYEFQIHSNRSLKANFALILKNGEKNSQKIDELEAENVKLQDRNLYQNGDWNTLCLPFSVKSLNGTPLEGFAVKELDTETVNNNHKTGLENGTLYLNFKDATGIVAGKPYIVKKVVTADLVIKSGDDWNTFAQNVSNGMSYEGKVVMLDGDIVISKMAGVSENTPFKGTFDGNGHTIDVTLNGDGEGLALFYAINGATIKNVKVEGTITSSKHRPATFTAFVEGNSTIKNCWSSVDIVSTKTEDWIDGGGFVARVSNGVTLNMTDCLFTGSVTYEDGACSGGSMVGFTQSGSKSILTNCMYSPTSLKLKVKNYNPHIFVSGDVRGQLTNCYYNSVAKESILDEEGIDGSNLDIPTLVSRLGTNWEVGTSCAIPKLTFGVNNLLFKDVTISHTEPTVITSKDGAVSFTGNYNPVSLAANDPTMFFMGSGNKLCYPSQASTINAFRAFLQANTIGDVNGDGTVNVTDVTLLVNHILGVQDENVVVKNLDINGDKMVSVTDVTALVNIILNGNKILKVVVNGADGITYGGAGSGPARAKESTLWEE